MESIADLFKIFRSYFSMSELQNEFASSVSIEFFGDELNALAAASAIMPEDGDVRIRPFPSSADECAVIGASTYSLFFIDESCMTIEELSRIFRPIPPALRKKIICCSRKTRDAQPRENINSLFLKISLRRPIWYSNDESFISELVRYLGKPAYAAARIYPGLRDALCDDLITKVSGENAGIALVSSIPADIPLIGPVAGLFAAPGETLLLTANQIRLGMRIAGIYGAELDFFDRMKELWPVLAGGFGWKAVAKFLVGVIPLAGPVLKSSIAFGGTYTVGFAAKCFYRDKRFPTAEELKKIYESAVRRCSKSFSWYRKLFGNGKNNSK
ncbi:MAG: hypothetical protein MJ234_03210 [bacterium]|nr:hypothetical protein [bacterium]